MQTSNQKWQSNGSPQPNQSPPPRKSIAASVALYLLVTIPSLCVVGIFLWVLGKLHPLITTFAVAMQVLIVLILRILPGIKDFFSKDLILKVWKRANRPLVLLACVFSVVTFVRADLIMLPPTSSSPVSYPAPPSPSTICFQVKYAEM